MFGLQSLSTSICLRCELRLLRQASRRFSAKAPSRIEPSQVPITRYDPKRASVKRLRSRIHGTPGKKVREDSANIPIDSLGAPSEILILRDTDIGNTERKPSVKVWNKRSAASSKEILESLEKEKTVPDRQETIEQIEALRPTNGQEDGEGGITIPQGQLDRLIEKLNESFIIRQLRLYYESHSNKADQAIPKFGRDWKNLGKQVKKAEDRRSADVADELRSCTVGVWRPGRWPLEQRLKAVPHHLHSTAVTGSRQTAKLRLIHEIIGRSWRVQSEEDAQAVGQLEVGVKTWQLKLLSGGEAPTILDTIAANRAAQVEVHNPAGVIRITADRWTAEYLAGDIEAALENLHVMPVDLRPFLERGTTRTEVADLAVTLLGSEAIRMIEGFTCTEIQAKSRSELHVRGLTAESVTDGYRHIIQLLEIPQRRASRVLWMEKGSTVTLQSTSLVEGLPLRHRKAEGNLLRWAKPVTNLQTTSADSNLHNVSTPPEDTKELDILSKLTVEQRPAHFNGRLPIDSVQSVIADMLCSRAAFQVPKRNPKTGASEEYKVRSLVDRRRKKESAAQSEPASAMQVSTHWLRAVTAETDAALGQVLHRSERDASHLETATVDLVRHRVWSPHAPGIMQAMTWLTASIPEDQLGATQNNRLVFRYLPSPIPFGKNNDRDAMRTFPELHVHINKETAEFMGMCLLLWSHYVDLMLPNHASDLRFVKRENLWTEAPGPGNEGAMDFIDAIVRSVKDPSAPLRAPPTIDLAIPAWTAIEKGRQVRGSKFLSVDPLVVRYMWAGVQLREQVNMQLSNPSRTLSYTAVQAGRIGGNWADFRLHLQGLPTKTTGIDTQSQIAAREFFDQALELTKVLHGSARRPVSLKSVKTKRRAVNGETPAVEVSQDFLSTSEGDAIDGMYAATEEDTASEGELLEDHDVPPRAAAVG